MSATNTDWTALQQAEDMAYFKADLCCYSPESYSLEEKKEICNEMVSTSKAMLDAMRADFELPTEARSKLFDMLCRSGVESPEWWWTSSSAGVTRSMRRLEPSRGQGKACVKTGVGASASAPMLSPLSVTSCNARAATRRSRPYHRARRTPP